MPHGTKIATCCYCGTRAALVLKGRERHELACSSCGAPLRELKSMPRTRSPSAKAKHSYAAPPKRRSAPKKKSKSRRKPGMRHFLGEAFELLEDVFD